MTRALLRPRFVGVALGLALVLGCFPSGAQARMVGSLDTTAPSPTPRQAQEAEVQRLLAEAKVAQALESAGLDVEQVRSRLDRLDEQQLEAFAKNLETLQAGKGTIYLLAALAVILLAVLIYMQIEAA